MTNDDHSGRQPRRALIVTGTLPFIIIPQLTANQWVTIPNHKNDLLESSGSDSVSDLCRTFLQEVFDTLITIPNWNTMTTTDWRSWRWPPKCPGFVVVTCFFSLICGIAQQSSCRLCVSWTGNRSFPAADPAFVRESTVDCANYPRMSKTKRGHAKLLQWGSNDTQAKQQKRARRWQVATYEKTRCTNWLLCNYRNERIFALIATKKKVVVWIERLLIGERPLQRTAIMRIPLDIEF